MLRQSTIKETRSVGEYTAKERILILMEAAELGAKNGGLTTQDIQRLIIELANLDRA